jgi:hypothetical protein
MFFSKNATYCEDASNVFCVLSRNVKCDREMRFQIFLSCRDISVNSFSWSCLIISSSMFWLSDSNFFEMTNALTRATYQTWRKRLIKLDTNDISSSLISNISSNLIKLDIKFDSCVSSNSVKTHQIWQYLIKLDENFVCSLWWAFLNDKRRCRIELNLLFKIVDRRM